MITVINIKTIKKYLVLIILLIIIGVCTRYFKYLKFETLENNVTKSLETYSFVECIEDTLPDINVKNTEKLEKIIVSSRGQSTRNILKSQLPMLGMFTQENAGVNENEALVDNEEEKESVDQAQIGMQTEEIKENNIEGKFTNEYQGVKVKNETDIQLNEEILTPDFELSDKNNIVIFHTHTCESYTPDEQYNYTMTGSYRTTDLNYTVARVGDELDTQLSSYGYSVTHDKTYHDYPAYSGSYGRSLTTVKNILASHSTAQMVIDLHRDAIGSNNNYAPSVRIGEETVAQLMFVIGSNGGGLEHPNWQQNLKFAIKVQQKANELYPGLFKPIVLRDSRYNQQLASAATIIEVGATGNTMEQCLLSMKYLAKVISEVVK